MSSHMKNALASLDSEDPQRVQMSGTLTALAYEYHLREAEVVNSERPYRNYVKARIEGDGELETIIRGNKTTRGLVESYQVLTEGLQKQLNAERDALAPKGK